MKWKTNWKCFNQIATGWDGVSPKIVQLTAKGLAPSLASFYNIVIRKGNWPNTWEMEEWTPVFKKGDKNEWGNYRPITVPNSIDKVFESLLSKQIIKTMDPNLYQKLSAYRKTQLWNMINKANRGLEDGCRQQWVREFSVHWYEQSFWLAAPRSNDSETQIIQLFRSITESYTILSWA